MAHKISPNTIPSIWLPCLIYKEDASNGCSRNDADACSSRPKLPDETLGYTIPTPPPPPLDSSTCCGCNSSTYCCYCSCRYCCWAASAFSASIIAAPESQPRRISGINNARIEGEIRDLVVGLGKGEEELRLVRREVSWGFGFASAFSFFPLCLL